MKWDTIIDDLIERRRQQKEITWGIYHRDREYAKVSGDPLLTTVRAKCKYEAERKARGVNSPTGVWAHPLGRQPAV